MLSTLVCRGCVSALLQSCYRAGDRELGALHPRICSRRVWKRGSFKNVDFEENLENLERF